MVDLVAGSESKAERSLMHRFQASAPAFTQSDTAGASNSQTMQRTIAALSCPCSSLTLSIECLLQIAHTVLSRILEDDGASGEGMLVLVSWLRYSAARHLTWNRNYNVKPREISAAQVSMVNGKYMLMWS